MFARSEWYEPCINAVGERGAEDLAANPGMPYDQRSVGPGEGDIAGKGGHELDGTAGADVNRARAGNGLAK